MALLSTRYAFVAAHWLNPGSSLPSLSLTVAIVGKRRYNSKRRHWRRTKLGL
ncbi:hypothetical protein WMY93_009063 [Mugilogobius chulae]|uniref:Ribosomal protein L39 n=1 Tax=Mugilogobius chulae TaxID=88201 RepID=A0AAW0PBQ2_9GOBI